MIQSFPRPINPRIKKQTDDQIAKVGQLNQLVRDINQLQLDPSSLTGIPFDWYPPAGLTTAGPKFTYTDGVEMISYHIQGVYPINNNGNGFEVYLCTVNFPSGLPFMMPGSITGMFQSGTGSDIITSPLCNGGLVEVDSVHVPISDFQINLYNYGNNPQPDGSYNYALVASASTVDSGSLSALMTYNFEFLIPNFQKAPTIFQD